MISGSMTSAKRDFGSFHSSNVQELLDIPEVKATTDFVICCIFLDRQFHDV